MAIDGLIILDNNGRPIIQTGFRSNNSAYPILHIDALINALAESALVARTAESSTSISRRAGDVDPVLHVQRATINTPASACCHVECADMRFLCPVSGDVDPLFAFAFLQTFIDILRDYFGNVTAATLKDNFDVVYQLLEETLDAGGHPLTTSPNALKEIVLPPSLMSKLLGAANINTAFSSQQAGTAGVPGGPFASPIPWRKANVRHNNNEIYFDVVEELKAAVNKHGTPLSSSVWGRIETNSKLSGTPDLSVSFSNKHVLTDCAFHPCVRLQRWTRDKAISFVPPDGHFTLAEYRYSPSASAGSSSSTASAGVGTGAGKDAVPIPFSVRTNIDADAGTLDITFISRLSTRALENVVVEMYLGAEATGARCVTSRAAGSASGGFGNGVAASEGASWAYDTKRKMLRWELGSVSPSASWNITGTFSSSSTPRPSHALRITFGIASHTFSALKVDQMKLTGEIYKPYKGVRGSSTGDVEWRW